MAKPILTAKVGTNADLFPDILKLYVPEKSRVLDMTYGKGVFWRKVEGKYNLVRNDLNAKLGDTHHDFMVHMPFRATFDAVILDPPYMHGSKSLPHPNIEKCYLSAMRPGWGTHYVNKMYFAGLTEAYRLLKSGGYAIVKCMDQIEWGKQHRHHVTIWETALGIGFIDEDLFVLVSPTTPMMRHSYQLHARKNNSFFWVFKKP